MEYGKYEQAVQNWSEMKQNILSFHFSLSVLLNFIICFFIAALFALKNTEGAVEEGLLKMSSML